MCLNVVLSTYHQTLNIRLENNVEICSLGVTPNPMLEGCGGMVTQVWLMGLEHKPMGFRPKHVVFPSKHVGANP